VAATLVVAAAATLVAAAAAAKALLDWLVWLLGARPWRATRVRRRVSLEVTRLVEVLSAHQSLR
jgi:hypothetical protein